MPRRFRSKATLRIMGDALVPDDVTRLLCCPPTRAETKGEVIRSKHSGRQRVARTGSWRLVANDRNPEDLEGRVAEIFSRLNYDPATWRALAEAYTIDLFVGLFMANDNEGLTLSPQALAMLSERHVTLSLDIYGLNGDD